MAITTYRYRWRGCEFQTIKTNVDPAILITIANAMPKAWVDINLDPGLPGSAAQTDLDSAMLSMGWVPFAIDPLTPLRGVTTKQEIYTPLLIDVTTASLVFVPFLSTPIIQTDSGFLDIQANISAISTIATYFRLLLNGAPVVDGGFSIGIGVGSTSIFKRVPILAGNHIIEIEWRVIGLGSVDIQPVTNPDSQSANLFVKEVVS
jgi:hypothetical protein